MEKKMVAVRVTGVGLCSTCTQDPVCRYPRRPGARVRECLDFQGEVRHEADRSPRAAFRPSGKDPVPAAREPGLCSWCEMKPTCTFPKLAGGVWFCEEYR